MPFPQRYEAALPETSFVRIDPVTGATFKLERLRLGNDLERRRFILHHQLMSRYYFAGKVFSLKHLLGNVALAQAIKRVSQSIPPKH